VFWLIASEIYPTTVRAQAMSLATLMVWATDFLVTMTFLSLVEALGPRRSFWVYAAACAAAVIFSLKMVPETKGRTLEEIETSWIKP
jgi:SP family arabinose:H+ symporter-like MFS transporter